MKIVHLNTYDGNGGAGRAVLRLHKGLKTLGVESSILCLYQFNSKSEVGAISQTSFGKIRALINIISERFLIRPYLKDNSIPFSLQRFGISPNQMKELQEADIIHIHWINHGFLASEQIKKLAYLNKKVVWTLHDSNPITGGCHVRYSCDHFMDQCGNCPVLKNSGAKDLSHQTWLKKNDAYQSLKFDFIAPSKWMGNRAREASLARQKKVHVISNALETDIFYPRDKQACRNEFNIDADALVILAGYMPSKFDRHKGLPELQDTIRHLAENPLVDKEKLLLVFYGSDGQNIKFDIPVNYRFAGKISDDEVLAKLYSLSDVFLFTSLEESMGYTALESLSCGTPVAAFETSGVTDVVLHQKNGYLAPSFDTKALADGLLWILQESVERNLAEAAREWAVSNFSLDVIAHQHLEVYKKLLTENP